MCTVENENVENNKVVTTLRPAQAEQLEFPYELLTPAFDPGSPGYFSHQPTTLSVIEGTFAEDKGGHSAAVRDWGLF